MSKRATEAAKEIYKDGIQLLGRRDRNNNIVIHPETMVGVLRNAAKKGYEQAEKNIISHIREQIERWMSKDNGEEYIKGERTAFNSVLHLLKEMEDEQ